MGLVLTAVLCALMLGVAVSVLGVDAPNLLDLWLFCWFAAATVVVGTLVLFATVGSPGQIIALMLFVYLGLASAGGTVPVQALPGILKLAGAIDPLRQIIDGVRAIIYFEARGDAGLTRGVVATAIGLIFWFALGTIVTKAYDRRGLSRLQPAVLEHVAESVRSYQAPVAGS